MATIMKNEKRKHFKRLSKLKSGIKCNIKTYRKGNKKCEAVTSNYRNTIVNNQLIDNSIIDNQIIRNKYRHHEFINKCLECGIDMGPQNPRQLCGKLFCLFND
tara:strand:+ start:194 stop:502 length:309 start_codon:yes stop_codon:yes gene_type:complete